MERSKHKGEEGESSAQESAELKPADNHCSGCRFSQLLQESMIGVIDNLQNQREAEQSLRRNLKKIQSFDIKQITFHQCIGYYILSKLYYLEQKCKDYKISFAKMGKQKNQLLEKVKGGLRKYDHIEERYSFYLDKHRVEEKPLERDSR